jgi:RNA recognition motif-containing protein
MSSKLYVGNLSFETTELDLQDYFAQAGTVQETALMQDRFTGKSRGFAFVTMSTAEEAQKAISLFHGKDFMNRSLMVNEARPVADRTGGGPRRSFDKAKRY